MASPDPVRALRFVAVTGGDVVDPVSLDEVRAAFAGLARYRHLVLAVSGGPDSMALMLLVDRLRLEGAFPDTEFSVATVDHGLRAQSAEEARWVQAEAFSRGFAHVVLSWDGEKPETGLMQAARVARYRLLGAHAALFAGPAAVVTAHTRCDQAETFLMRLKRGSGLDGLAAMAPNRALSGAGVDLVRPLLSFSKAQLKATLTAASCPAIADPSNDRMEFERVKLRADAASLAAMGLSNEMLARSASRLGRAREALDFYACSWIKEHVAFHGGLYAGFERAAFAALPAETRVRVLAILFRLFGGVSPQSRLASVEEVVALFEAGDRVAMTIGGVMVSAGLRRVRIHREPERGTLPVLALDAGEQALWDGRFLVSVGSVAALESAGLFGPFVVKGLGMAAYATLRRQLATPPEAPAGALAAIPGFWSKDRLVAVPTLVHSEEGLRIGLLGSEHFSVAPSAVHWGQFSLE